MYFPAGTIPYLKPNVPATGKAVTTPPPNNAPSAPNLIFSLKSSIALSLPFNSLPL